MKESTYFGLLQCSLKSFFGGVYSDAILTFKFSGSKSSPKCSCRGVILFSSLSFKITSSFTGDSQICTVNSIAFSCELA